MQQKPTTPNNNKNCVKNITKPKLKIKSNKLFLWVKQANILKKIIKVNLMLIHLVNIDCTVMNLKPIIQLINIIRKIINPTLKLLFNKI